METKANENNINEVLDVEDIKAIIPYDVPFLFIDKVIRLEKDIIISTKHIKEEEPFFKGHFVDFSIMPGALIIEGIGQTATLIIRKNIQNHKEKEILAYKIKDAVFKAPVFPGDTITFEVRLIMLDERFAITRGKALVKDRTIAECLMMLAIVLKSEFRGKYGRQ